MEDTVRKQLLLNAIMKKKKQKASETPHEIPLLERKDGENYFFAGQSLLMYWEQYQSNSESQNFNMNYAYRILGKLKINFLQQAIDQVCKEQESLRCTFQCNGNDLIQKVVKPFPHQINLIDLSEESEEKKDVLLRNTSSKEINRAFNLEIGPLIYFSLIKAREEDYVFIISSSHIICDGWSIKILMSSICSYYNKLTQGESIINDNQQIQYADYVSWKRKFFGEEEKKKQIAYWREEMKKSSQNVILPFDKLNERGKQGKAMAVFTEILGEKFQKLKRYAVKHRCTVNMVILTSVEILLYKYTGIAHMRIQSVFSGRRCEELYNIIGNFTQTPPPMIVEFLETITLEELLNQVKQMLLNAFDNQDCKEYDIHKELNLPKNGGDDTTKTIIYNYVSNSCGKFQIDGTQIENYPLDMEVPAMNSIMFQFNEQDECIEGIFIYDSSMYSESLMEKYKDTLMEILDMLLDEKMTTVADVIHKNNN